MIQNQLLLSVLKWSKGKMAHIIQDDVVQRIVVVILLLLQCLIQSVHWLLPETSYTMLSLPMPLFLSILMALFLACYCKITSLWQNLCKGSKMVAPP